MNRLLALLKLNLANIANPAAHMNAAPANGTFLDAYNSSAQPTLTGISPAVRGQRSAKVTLTVTGTGFQPGATVSVSATAKTGARTLTVANPDGATAACAHMLYRGGGTGADVGVAFVAAARGQVRQG